MVKCCFAGKFGFWQNDFAERKKERIKEKSKYIHSIKFHEKQKCGFGMSRGGGPQASYISGIFCLHSLDYPRQTASPKCIVGRDSHNVLQYLTKREEHVHHPGQCGL